MKQLWRHAFDPVIRVQAFLTSLTVGTILVLINLSERLLESGFTGYLTFKTFLTYLVPYSVATFSALRMQQRVEPGQHTVQSGIYRCESCLENGELRDEFLEENDPVPSCDHHGYDTVYVLREVQDSPSVEEKSK